MQKNFCTVNILRFLENSLCIGTLESVFRAIVNRLRVYPPSLWQSGGLEGLPAVIMAGWTEFFGEEVVVARIKI